MPCPNSTADQKYPGQAGLGSVASKASRSRFAASCYPDEKKVGEPQGQAIHQYSLVIVQWVFSARLKPGLFG